MEIKVDFATEKDLDAVYSLNQENLRENVPNQKEGFLTFNPSKSDWKKYINNKLIVVAKDKNFVAGYLLIFDEPPNNEFFNPIVKGIKKLKIKHYFLLAQDCIHRDYRGKGILNMLYDKIKQIYKKKYHFGIGEIEESNKISYYVHINKIGMEKIGEYFFEGFKWNLVSLNLRK
ncbi:MAG: hypothetical protein Q8Q04_01995 [archaeon]|nr:hypothetical protein [archaeon]